MSSHLKIRTQNDKLRLRWDKLSQIKVQVEIEGLLLLVIKRGAHLIEHDEFRKLRWWHQIIFYRNLSIYESYWCDEYSFTVIEIH